MNDGRIQALVEASESAKAIDVRALDLREFDTCGEYYIIMTATSPPHMRALVNTLSQKIKSLGMPKPRVEGARAGRWVLLDCGDIIIHMFLSEARIFYGIERLWSDD